MSDELERIGGVVRTVRAGFNSGKTRPTAWRKAQLRRMREMIEREEGAILAALAADLGKCAFEGWITEISLIRSEIDHTLSHLDDWIEPEKVRTPIALQPARSRIYRQPLGVVLNVSPWNYPFQLSVAPLIGALAAGNAVILKPSEISVNTSALLADLLPKYLDSDCVAVVQGGIPETTRLLEERFDHIFYTGNGHVGRIIMKAAAEHLTPVTLELGGKSPCIVHRSADLDVAARRIAWGKFVNAGQTCVAPDYILCEPSLKRQLVAKLSSTIETFFGRDPKTSPDYGRIVSDRHFERLVPLLESGEVAFGGQSDATQRYIAPTILTSVNEDSAAMADEIFGPILPIVEVASIDSAIAFVNERPKPLALYIFATDKNVVDSVLGRTSSGGACANDVVAHLGVPDLPFGGVGASGMGGYHGRTSFESFSHRRSVLHKSNHLDAPLRYPPYTDAKFRWVRRLV